MGQSMPHRSYSRRLPVKERFGAERSCDEWHRQTVWMGRRRAIGQAFGGYVSGTLVAMLLIGSFTGVGLALLGVPYGLLLSILAGLTELLPYLGPWISGTVSVLVALITVDPFKALQVILLFLLIQQIEGNVVIVVVLIGIDLLGIIGAILAAPVAAAIQILIVEVLAPAIRRALATPATG